MQTLIYFVHVGYLCRFASSIKMVVRIRILQPLDTYLPRYTSHSNHLLVTAIKSGSSLS